MRVSRLSTSSEKRSTAAEEGSRIAAYKHAQPCTKALMSAGEQARAQTHKRHTPMEMPNGGQAAQKRGGASLHKHIEQPSVGERGRQTDWQGCTSSVTINRPIHEGGGYTHHNTQNTSACSPVIVHHCNNDGHTLYVFIGNVKHQRLIVGGV